MSIDGINTLTLIISTTCFICGFFMGRWTKSAPLEGWVMVPREPDELMLNMGENVILVQHARAGITPDELEAKLPPYSYCGAREVYRAMIKTAPPHG